MIWRCALGFTLILAGCNTLASLTDDSTTATSAPVAQEESPQTLLKKRVLVLPFLNRSDVQEEALSRAALTQIEQAVTNTPDWILVKEAELEDPESLYSPGGEYQYKKVFEQAKRSAVAGVILGKIEEVTLTQAGDATGVLGARERSAVARIRFQLFDVSTEREVFTQTSSAEAKQERVAWLELRSPSSETEEGKEAVSRAVKKVLEKFPLITRKLAWMGRIARIDLNRYIVNGGEQTGIHLGQLLRVYEPSAPVTDELTGKNLGLAPGRFKGLLKVTQMFGTDSAIASLYTGAGFRQNDRVEIHQTEDENK